MEDVFIYRSIIVVQDLCIVLGKEHKIGNGDNVYVTIDNVESNDVIKTQNDQVDDIDVVRNEDKKDPVTFLSNLIVEVIDSIILLISQEKLSKITSYLIDDFIVVVEKENEKIENNYDNVIVIWDEDVIENVVKEIGKNFIIDY